MPILDDKKEEEWYTKEVKSLRASGKGDELMGELKEDIKVDDKVEQEEEEEEEEEELEVEKWKHPKTGVEYYITEDNILYSMESEPVGRWNPDSGEIEEILDLEED